MYMAFSLFKNSPLKLHVATTKVDQLLAISGFPIASPKIVTIASTRFSIASTKESCHHR